nr:nucleotide pyrophosphatase/phosphodiesterase family protein [Austwickia sp. TVS 96-490-7B]
MTPRYDGAGLAGVLPAVSAALGVPLPGLPSPQDPDWPMPAVPPARRAVVVLVDGLGLELLRRRSGHAPYLRSLLPDAGAITSGFPSTTATSMGTFGTGLPPGAHGLVGYEVLVPERDRLVNELSWLDGPDPLAWQPSSTVFEQLTAADVPVTMIGPAYFDGSGLTRAALRGATFRAADQPHARVPAALAALRAHPRCLVYLYWGEVDRAGHEHGCASSKWGEAVEEVDAALRRLAGQLPPDTLLVVTADHGMVDIPFADRIDLAIEPELGDGVRHLGGEARSPQLYVRPGATTDVWQRWNERLGDQAHVLTRQEALDAGWFGPPGTAEAAIRREEVSRRIGDIVISCRSAVAVVDSRCQPPRLLRLLGLHGALTRDEVLVPLLIRHPGGGRG